MFEIALTHYQWVSLILINFLKDPKLVQYFIPFLKNAELEDSRLFHINQTPYKYSIKPASTYLQNICFFRKGLLRKLEVDENILDTGFVEFRYMIYKCLTISENISYVRSLFDNSEDGNYFKQFAPVCKPIRMCVSNFLKSNHPKLEQNIPYNYFNLDKPPPNITIGHDIHTKRPKIIMVYI